MQSEPDHAADAGVGAQALLGLSKIRQEDNARSQTIANLSGAHNLHALSQRHLPLTRLGAQPTGGNPLQSPINVPPLQFAAQQQHEAPKEEPRVENKSNANTNGALDDTAPKLPIPRFPSISNTEGRTHNATFPPIAAPANVSESLASGLPRLASIAEWVGTRTPPMPAAGPALPGFSTLPAVHGMQPPLPSLPAPTTRQEYAAPTWINPAVPTLRPPYTAAETPVHHSYHLASPRMYAVPPPPPPLQANVAPYYYPPSATAQYPSLPPALPHLRPPTPQASTMHIPSISGPSTYLPSMTSSVLPHPSLGHLPVPSSHLNANSLPPIVNGLGKPISNDEPMLPPAGDTLTQRASVTQLVNKPEVTPALPAPMNETKNIPIRSSAFAAPTSSGRGLVDLMNPTDTLATVASSSPPLPLQKAPAVQVSKPTANMKMARELFGSGSKDLLRPTNEKPSAVLRTEDKYKRGNAHSLPNGNARAARPDVLPAVSEIGKMKSNMRLGNAGTFEQKNSDSSRLGVKKEMNFSRKHADKQGTARRDDGKSSRRSSLGDRNSSDSSGEITRCPCGSKADCGVMICCDQCNTWQHRICMGFRRKSDVPHNYYCNICRPEEMRPGCVAHPDYFELLEMEGKDAQCDPILHSVKPLELRRLFSADLKAKREGTEEFRRSHVFKRYAMMYRAQFGKDRASVIEGLVVLTELRRSEVEEKLEEAIKRTKKDGESLDLANGLRKKSSIPHAAQSNKIHGVQPLARPSAKRGRPPGSVSENAAEKLGTPRGMQTGASPDKEFGSGDRNRMSREERKMQQVVSLFARLEEREREKKRPRLGEPSGSMRSASFASPRPIGGNSSRSRISPNANLNLTPALVEVDINADQRNVASEINRNNTRSPVPKRERSTKERKEHRRKEPREERGEPNRRNNLLSRRRERQVLSSSAYRKRGKSYSRGVSQVDPRFQVKVHIPGPSVVGSKLVPSHRRSRLDNSAIEEENRKLNAGPSMKSRKERVLLSAEKSNDRAYSVKVPPRYHPLRKRLVQYAEPLREVLDRNGAIKSKSNRTGTSDKISDAEYILPESEARADARHHANLLTEFSFNKRFLNRMESGAENGSRPRTGKDKRSEVEKLAFKKRIMRGEPPRSSLMIRVVPEKKPEEPVRKERKDEPDENVEMSENPAESKKDVAMGDDDVTKVESGKRPPDKGVKPMETTVPKSSKTPIVPRLRSSPLLRSSTPKASGSPPPLRSAVIRMNTSKASKSSDTIPLPSRSLASSPVLGNPGTPPALRSVAVKGELPKTGSSSTSKLPSKSISANPPPRLTQTPPLTQHRVNPLRSKPVGQFEPRNSNSSIGNLLPQVNGKGADVSGPSTSSSDILAARLEGFYSQSKTADTNNDSASPKPAGKPQPQPILGQGHARYTHIPSPRIGGKYRGAPGRAPSSPAVRMNGKAGSSTDTTPWGRYRKQNGWDAPPGKHVGYREGGPAPQDGKGGSGRRRPYG